MVKDIERYVQQKLGSGFTVTSQRNLTTNNGVCDFTISVREGNSDSAPVIHVNELVDEVIAGTMTVEAAGDIVIRKAMSAEKIEAPKFTKERVLNGVFYFLINTEKNAELLEHIPHSPLAGDICMVYRMKVDGIGDGVGTLLIKNEILSSLGITMDELVAAAEVNTPNLLPIRQITEVGIWELGDSLPIFSNDLSLYGAGVIAYPGFLEERAEIEDSDLVIIPSSIHEVIILPKNDVISLEGIKETIEYVNRNCVEPSEFLSDSPLVYRRSEKRLYGYGEA